MYPRGFRSREGCARGADPPETGDRATSREIRRPGFDSRLRRLLIGLATFPMGERGGRESDAGRGARGVQGGQSPPAYGGGSRGGQGAAETLQYVIGK